MGQTEAESDLYLRIEFVRGKVMWYEALVEAMGDGDLGYLSDDDIDEAIQSLEAYARELDALESYAWDIRAERNGH